MLEGLTAALVDGDRGGVDIQRASHSPSGAHASSVRQAREHKGLRFKTTRPLKLALLRLPLLTIASPLLPPTPPPPPVRAARIKQRMKQRESEEVAECTFRPQILRPPRWVASPTSARGSVSSGERPATAGSAHTSPEDARREHDQYFERLYAMRLRGETEASTQVGGAAGSCARQGGGGIVSPTTNRGLSPLIVDSPLSEDLPRCEGPGRAGALSLRLHGSAPCSASNAVLTPNQAQRARSPHMTCSLLPGDVACALPGCDVLLIISCCALPPPHLPLPPPRCLCSCRACSAKWSTTVRSAPTRLPRPLGCLRAHGHRSGGRAGAPSMSGPRKMERVRESPGVR